MGLDGREYVYARTAGEVCRIKITTPRLPVYYPWHVIGLSGRPFTGYKFTTMVASGDCSKWGAA